MSAQTSRNHLLKLRTTLPAPWLLLLPLLLLAQPASAFYNPSTGRWLSRDPIAEAGGQNLYCNSRNDAINHYDPIGLFITDTIWHLNEPANSPIFARYSWASALTVPKQRTYEKTPRPDDREKNCLIYKVEVTAIYDIFVKVGSTPDSRTRSGGSLGAHEMGHVSAYNTPLLDFEGSFNGFKLCCAKKCQRPLENWMDAAFEVAKTQGNYDSTASDRESGDYAPDNPYILSLPGVLAKIDAELKQLKASEASANLTFQDCLKQVSK